MYIHRLVCQLLKYDPQRKSFSPKYKFSIKPKTKITEKPKTYATSPPKKATGPPPISRILRWHESNSDIRACGGGDGCVCIPIMPPDVGP